MINIEENVPLAPLTTFKVGGSARYFARVTSTKELHDAIQFVRDKNVPIFILGGGSNIIINDSGFDGLVVKIDINDFKIDEHKIVCGAGVPFGAIVSGAIQNSLAGLEWAAGIPGTVGGAVRGNAGAFGGETKDVVASVTSIDPDSGKIYNRDNGECGFGYRDSIFKQNSEIIIGATFALTKGDSQAIQKIAKEHIEFRREKHPIEFPCAGSVFKNVAADSVSGNVRKIFEDSIKTDPFPVIPAAKIIAEAGLSGKKIGGAQVSTKHTNYIINSDNAKADDIVKLIDEVRQTVWDKYKIELEIEPQLVGLELGRLAN